MFVLNPAILPEPGIAGESSTRAAAGLQLAAAAPATIAQGLFGTVAGFGGVFDE
jgi:hypothetical protein